MKLIGSTAGGSLLLEVNLSESRFFGELASALDSLKSQMIPCTIGATCEAIPLRRAKALKYLPAVRRVKRGKPSARVADGRSSPRPGGYPNAKWKRIADAIQLRGKATTAKELADVLGFTNKEVSDAIVNHKAAFIVLAKGLYTLPSFARKPAPVRPAGTVDKSARKAQLQAINARLQESDPLAAAASTADQIRSEES
jgi:hypothetical protein